jgi:DNA mismatch repair protein MutS
MSAPDFTRIPPDYPGKTPLMQQYFATRKEHPGTLLLIRVGDFYEAYGDDAESTARDLDLTLTRRNDGGTWVAMAGVPYHTIDRFIARLLRKGRRVAIMDEVEDK